MHHLLPNLLYKAHNQTLSVAIFLAFKLFFYQDLVYVKKNRFVSDISLKFTFTFWTWTDWHTALIKQWYCQPALHSECELCQFCTKTHTHYHHQRPVSNINDIDLGFIWIYFKSFRTRVKLQAHTHQQQQNTNTPLTLLDFEVGVLISPPKGDIFFYFL